MTEPTAALAADYSRLLSGLHRIADAVREYDDLGRTNHDAHRALYEVTKVLASLRQNAGSAS